MFDAEVKDRIKVIIYNTQTWEFIKSNLDKIKDLLDRQEVLSEQDALFLYYSPILILSELFVNEKAYQYYEAKNLTEEDFVDILIEPHFDISGIKNVEEIKKSIDNDRSILWGYIKYKLEEINRLFIKCYDYLDNKIDFSFSEDDTYLFFECLAVIYTECILRQLENTLENVF